MKISTVSKKVLASALSAAMVVAFAPTVAFGKAGDIAVTIDLDGGVGTVPVYTQAEQGKTIDLSSIAPTKNGYGLQKWVYDADGDPTTTADNETTFTSGTTTLPTRSEVTIKAVYNLPEAAVTAVDNASTAITTAKGANAETPTHTIKVSLADTNFKKGANYTVKVTNPDGTALLTKELNAAKADQKAPALADTTIYFVEQPLSVTGSDTSVQVRDELLVSGDYKIEVYEGSTLVSSAKKTLAIATFKDSVTDKSKTTTTYDKKWKTGKTATVTAPSTAGISWLDADGYFAAGPSATITIKGDATFTATDVAQTVDKGSYTGTVNTRTMSFPVEADAPATGWTASYKATVTAPDGSVIFSKTLAAADVQATNGTTLQFTFDQDPTTAVERVAAGITEAAGTYVCSVEMTLKKDGEDDKVSTSKSYVKLTEVKVDAGEGSFSTTNKLNAKQKDYFVANTAGTTATVTTPNSNTVVAPEGKTFDTWTCGDAKAGSAATITVTEGAVNTITAVYKEAAASTEAKVPTVASAVKNADGSYTIKLTSEDGTKIAYASTNGVDANTVLLNGADVATYNAATGIEKYNQANLYVQAQVISGATKLTDPSKVAQISWDQSAFKNVVAGAASYLEKYIGNSKVKYLEQEDIKAAIAAGQAALDTQVADVATDWNKLVTAQLKGVYDAVAAYAASAIAAYENGAYVTVGDKVYEMTAKKVTDAQTALKKVTDKVAKDEADKAKVLVTCGAQTRTVTVKFVVTK